MFFVTTSVHCWLLQWKEYAINGVQRGKKTRPFSEDLTNESHFFVKLLNSTRYDS